MTDKIKEAKEWFDNKFRGSTVYDGHPIQTIGELLERADLVPTALPETDEAHKALNRIMIEMARNGIRYDGLKNDRETIRASLQTPSDQMKAYDAGIENGRVGYVPVAVADALAEALDDLEDCVNIDDHGCWILNNKSLVLTSLQTPSVPVAVADALAEAATAALKELGRLFPSDEVNESVYLKLDLALAAYNKIKQGE